MPRRSNMGQLTALVILVLFTATLAEGNVIKPRLKRGLRSSRLTKQWRRDTGVGFFKDVGTAGGNALAKPRSAGCTQEGFFPQPGSCTDFIRCVDFIGTGKFFSVFRFNCPFGTVFDADLGICNHPYAVINPPECAGAVPNLPLPEPPGVDSTPGTTRPTPRPIGDGTTARPTATTEDTEPCNGTLAPYPTPQPTTFQPTTLRPITLRPTTLRPTTFQPTSLRPITLRPTTLQPATLLTTTQQFTTVDSIDETTFPIFFETTTAASMWEVDPTSIFNCPAPGYYPFEGDCVRFYKCVETIEGKLKGLLYKCPGGYGYSAERKRCWPEAQMPACQRRSPMPVERFESATEMYPEDLLWFFNNKK